MSNKTSFKNLRGTGLKHSANGGQSQGNEPLNIQAKSILNPLQKQESNGFLNKVAKLGKKTSSNDSPTECLDSE